MHPIATILKLLFGDPILKQIIYFAMQLNHASAVMAWLQSIRSFALSIQALKKIHG